MAHPSELEREWFWRDLIRRFDRRLRAYLRRARWSPEELEELLWDVWAASMELEEVLVSTGDQWSILRRLAAQVSARQLRVRRREFVCGDSIAEASLSDPAGEAFCDGEVQRAWIDHALAQLTEQQRLAVDYRFRWRWPYWAVAAAIGTAEPTARVHVKRGLERLREIARGLPPQCYSRGGGTALRSGRGP